MVRHRMDWDVHEIAVDPVLVQAECRDGADGIADLDPFDALADGGHRPRRLVAVPGREPGLFEVLAATEHRLRAIEPQRLDADLDLPLAGVVSSGSSSGYRRPFLFLTCLLENTVG